MGDAPEVKLVALGGKLIKDDAIQPVKRPLIAVVGHLTWLLSDMSSRWKPAPETRDALMSANRLDGMAMLQATAK